MAEDTGTTEQSKRKGRGLRAILIGLVVLIALAIGGWFAWQAYTAKPDIWAPTTVPLDPECKQDCETVAVGAGGHGASHPEDQVEFKYNPKVDDDIAQYGDCLESIVTCVEGLPPDDADGHRGCVADSICPQYCKDTFAQSAAGDADAVEKAFFDLFIDPAGNCVPEGA